MVFEGDRRSQMDGPFVASSGPRVPRLSRLGDGTVALVDRERVHLFDGARWRTLIGPGAMTRAGGPSAQALCVVAGKDEALHERDGGGWRRARLPIENRGVRAVHGARDRVVAVATDRDGSWFVERDAEGWRAQGRAPHFVFDVAIHGRHHVAARSLSAAFVHRGAAWDRVAPAGGRGTWVDFVTVWGGHTVLGGLDPEGRAWFQVGRRAHYLAALRGAPAASPRAHVVSLLDDGRLALLGEDRLWLSEPIGSLAEVADESFELDLEDDRPRAVRVAETATTGAFEIDRRPVTNRDWARIAAAAGLAIPRHWPRGRVPPDREDHPVVGVGPEDAARYAAALGMRLPTEDEWELAAAGPSGSFTPDPPLDDWAPARAPVHLRTRAVTRPSRPSPLGLEHLGMVWEWTATPHEAGGRIIRGGPFRDRLAAPRVENRSVERGPAPDVGFRCARSPSAASLREPSRPYR